MLFRVVSSVILHFFLCSSLTAQIAGLTGTKAVSIAVDVIPTHTIEFSPTWSFNRFNGFYTSNGESVRSDTIDVQNGVCWMVNYGLSEKIEVGINIPGSFEPVSLGVKHTLFKRPFFWGGVMMGLNIPLQNRRYDSNNLAPEDVSSLGLGLVGKLIVNEKSSLDINAQFQDWFQEQNGLPNSAWYITAEYGTYILSEQLMLMAAANYQTFDFESGSNKFSAGPGLSFEYDQNFVLVLSTMHDFFGKSFEKGMFSQFGLTLILD